MSHLDLLTFARGSALNWALVMFAAGIVLRLFEIFGLGRKADLARPRTDTPGSGWRTMFTRSLPPEGMLKRDPVTYIGGYVFHLGSVCSNLLLCAAYRILPKHDRIALVQSADSALVDASVVAVDSRVGRACWHIVSTIG